ncbi:GNAT family N-acetyltransferase [bacterium K02(2017)]|nr:GNAT family N-acetyltransferase [bacterium K02(2017)]
MSDIQIRSGTIEDSSVILQFITELATYERAKNEVIATVDDIQKTLFGKGATAHSLICSKDKECIGFAVYFYNYSTWLGKNGLYLEDLYISPKFRGQGAGIKLLKHLAAIAVANDCGRFEWSVLDWNEPAIKLYESFGAKAQNEWVGYRLEGSALENFAKEK